jgi:hypothetical protein
MQESIISQVSVLPSDPIPPNIATLAAALAARSSWRIEELAPVIGLEAIPPEFCDFERAVFDREDEAEGGGGEDFDGRDLGSGAEGGGLAGNSMRPNAERSEYELVAGFERDGFQLKAQSKTV